MKVNWKLLGWLSLVLLLIVLPILLVVFIGRPGGPPAHGTIPRPPLLEPISGPTATTGPSAQLLRIILLAGSALLGVAIGAWLLFLLLHRELSREPLSTNTRFYLLLVLGVASAAVYALNFLLPFPLSRYFNLKLAGIGSITGYDAGVALATALGIVALFLLYGLAHRLCQGQNARRLWAVVIASALVFCLCNYFVDILTSLDIYDYIARGRITGMHVGNPYVEAPQDYSYDPFMSYASWYGATSAYGPLWETASGLTAAVAGNTLWGNVMAYKGLATLSYLLCVVLVGLTLQRTAPKRALAGTLLFAWNPLIIMEGVQNAHNDLLMVALMLAALWVLCQKRPSTEAPPSRHEEVENYARGLVVVFLLLAGVLIKFIPILLFPLVLLYVLAGQQSFSRWLGRAALLMLPVGMLIVEYYVVFWKWPQIADTFLRRGTMFRMSINSVLMEALLKLGDRTSGAVAVSAQTAQSVASYPFYALFGLAYLAVVGRAVWTLGRPGERLGRQIGLFIGAVGGGLFGLVAGFLSKAWASPLATLAMRLGTPGSLLGLSLDGTAIRALAFFVGTVLGVLGGGLLGLVAVLVTRRRERETDPWRLLLLACTSAFLLYLLLANFWWWPWYMTWPIALVALSGDERLISPMMLAGLAGELSHLGWNFVWYWWGVSWDTLYEVDAMIVFALVVPAMIAYAVISMRRRRAAALEAEVVETG